MCQSAHVVATPKTTAAAAATVTAAAAGCWLLAAGCRLLSLLLLLQLVVVVVLLLLRLRLPLPLAANLSLASVLACLLVYQLAACWPTQFPGAEPHRPPDSLVTGEFRPPNPLESSGQLLTLVIAIKSIDLRSIAAIAVAKITMPL